MQVVSSLRRLATGPIAVAIIAAAQLLQPARVEAQNNDFKNEAKITEAQKLDAQRLINELRARLPSCNLVQGGQAFIVQASNVRRERPALTWNAKLADIARGHSQNMASNGFFDHVDTAGRSVAERAKAAGYRYRVVAENIAAGQDSVNEALMEWIASKGHCENMIDERVTEFGLALVQSKNPQDPYSTYWTLVLGTPAR